MYKMYLTKKTNKMYKVKGCIMQNCDYSEKPAVKELEGGKLPFPGLRASWVVGAGTVLQSMSRCVSLYTAFYPVYN